MFANFKKPNSMGGPSWHVPQFEVNVPHYIRRSGKTTSRNGMTKKNTPNENSLDSLKKN